MTRTASGMSMLLGTNCLNIKTVIKNLDDFYKPLVMLTFNEYAVLDSALDVEGDLEVKATGTNSLMQKSKEPKADYFLANYRIQLLHLFK